MKQTLELLRQLQELDHPSKTKSAPDLVAALRKRLPAPVLAHYDRCRARGRNPLAAMSDDGVCRGCNMRGSRGLVAALQRGDEIQVCENCGRYLVWETGQLNMPELQRS